MSRTLTKIACCVLRFVCVVVYVLLGGGIFVLIEPFDEKYDNDADRFFEYSNLAFMSVTTIGDTAVFPTTTASRIAYIVYSSLGIPLVLWALASAGELQTRLYRSIFCERRIGDWTEDHSSPDNGCARCRCIPFFISSFVFLGIGALGGFLTTLFTKATFVTACYFWWTTWTTIGYGEETLSNHRAFIFWKWFGLVLLSGVIHSYLRWMVDLGDSCEFYCCKCNGPNDGEVVEAYVAKSTDLHFERVMV